MNILIVEDEAHTARFLKEVIEQEDDFIVVSMLDSIAASVAYLSRHQKNIDLLFLDIQLSDGSSFEIFKHIDVAVPVIFCTAYDEYTLQAIKNNGIDYILKPFEEVAVHDALKKYKRLVSTLQSRHFSMPVLPGSQAIANQESFLTQLREKTIVIETGNIALFAIEHETVFIYTFRGEKHPLFKGMDYIESVLNPVQFFRISRQMLVNRDAIISMEPYFNRKVIVQLKVNPEEKAIVSRLKVAPFKGWLEKGN